MLYVAISGFTGARYGFLDKFHNLLYINKKLCVCLPASINNTKAGISVLAMQ